MNIVWMSSVACLVTSAFAQAPSKQPVPKVSFHYQNLDQQALAGSADTASRNALIVRVELEEGWHINSDAPLDSFLVPTAVSARAEGLAFAKPIYPKPELQHSQLMGGDIALFTGAFDIRIPYAVDGIGTGQSKGSSSKADAPPRTSVTLNYQSCNNSMCLPPKSITVDH
ncbi:MAG: protein-disulfide reductase DsbD domain-containing protein [Fibrobacteria bacterium]